MPAESSNGRFRMFIDESGNHDLKNCELPTNRYLCLLGLVIAEGDQPDLESRICAMKETFFGYSNVVLHRKDIMDRRPPFDGLLDADVEKLFQDELVNLCRAVDFVAISALIDKLEHLERYKVWQKDPYHYCLEVLLERYVLHLEDLNGRGDVFIESRGKKLDKKLKRLYHHFHKNGTDYLPTDRMQARLTSKELNIKPKAANISGLQLCDLLAQPIGMAARARRQNKAIARNFGGRLAIIVEAHKYRRSRYGKVDGWGRKWLP